MNTETCTYDYDTRPFDYMRGICAGSSIVTADGRVVGADDTLSAHGTTICLVLTPR